MGLGETTRRTRKIVAQQLKGRRTWRYCGGGGDFWAVDGFKWGAKVEDKEEEDTEEVDE